jgi:hypothetical protein
MFPLQRSSSFLAYTYESDEEAEDEDYEDDCCLELCGGRDGVGKTEQTRTVYIDETTALVLSSVTPRAATSVVPPTRSTTTNSGKRIDLLLVGTIALAVSMLVFYNFFLLRRSGSGEDLIVTAAAVQAASASRISSSATTNTTTTIQTSSTRYGEVWLIRHGEKDFHLPPSGKSSRRHGEQRAQKLRAMYELSQKGWDRAHHLSSLVEQGEWPLFSALFASRPATPEEALEAYPGVAHDATGQSMVWREYQTLVPISEYLQNNNIGDDDNYYYNSTSIRTPFPKGEVEAVALEIAKTAVADASASGGKPQEQNSAVVLVSWDHCSLPTLVVKGFGCRSSSSSSDLQQKDSMCYRCWSDDRFGDVLKLNVSLVATTTTTTVTTKTKKTTTKDVPEASITKPKTTEIVSHDYRVSSTILTMTGEAYPADQYYHAYDNPSNRSKNKSNNNNNNNNETTPGFMILSASTPASIEKSTPCAPSYCTTRPASKHLVRCSCWDSSLSLRTLPQDKSGGGG